MIIVLFALLVVAVRIFYTLGEAWYERDWPRETWLGTTFSILLLFLSVQIFS